MSSSIFVSKRKLMRYCLVLASFYFLLFLSFGIFIISPKLFYYRSLEYYDEVGYWIPEKERWNGFEMGGDERANPHQFPIRYKRLTRVTCNKEGSRETPYKADQYPLLFMGDSHMWGCMLSDEETIPWKVAKNLNVPTYNAGRNRRPIASILANPKLKNAQIIVELITSCSLPSFTENESLQSDRDIGFKKKKTYLNFFKVPPNRFFFISKIIRAIDVNRPIKKLFAKMPVNKIFKINFSSSKHSHTDYYGIDDEAVNTISKKVIHRARLLEKNGYVYVFGVIPHKDTMICDNIDQKLVDFNKMFAKLLREQNIHYINLFELFKNRIDHKYFYFPTDCHMNQDGAEIIANEVAEYLCNHFPQQIEICRRVKNSTDF